VAAEPPPVNLPSLVLIDNKTHLPLNLIAQSLVMKVPMVAIIKTPNLIIKNIQVPK
jgi:hypothetical protein